MKSMMGLPMPRSSKEGEDMWKCGGHHETHEIHKKGKGFVGEVDSGHFQK
jgi:hypothetical protein